MVIGSGSVVTLPLVVPPVLHHCSSSTLWTMPVLVSPTMPNLPRVEVLVNSTALSMSTGRLWLLTVSLVSTVVSFLPSSVSLFTVVFTLVCTTPSVSILSDLLCEQISYGFMQSPSSWLVLLRALSWLPSVLVGVLPSVLVLLPTLSTLSGALQLCFPFLLISNFSFQSSYDDDFWLWCQLQVHVRCWLSNHCQGGYKVSVQGCWCQHSPWCCWCWCVVALRQAPTGYVRQGLLWWIWLNVSLVFVGCMSLGSYTHCFRCFSRLLAIDFLLNYSSFTSYYQRIFQYNLVKKADVLE